MNNEGIAFLFGLLFGVLFTIMIFVAVTNWL